MTELSRRRVVVILGGSALATGVAAQGLLMGSSRAGRPTRGRGKPTNFGSVAVLGATTSVLAAGRTADHHSGTPGFVPRALRPWSDLVRIEVEVHNGTDHAIPMSPGQFRLKVGRDGPTVTPFETGPASGRVAPGSTTGTWVSYLAPPDAQDLSVEFTEADASRVRTFPLAAATPTVGQHGHDSGSEGAS